MKRFCIACIIVFVIFFMIGFFSESDHKKVISVIDGDTIVIDQNKVKVKIRLAEIDSPENKQPFGIKSKDVLEDKILGKWVVIDGKKKDRDQRIIGKVYLNGRYINQEMVKEGYAWHYPQYSNSKELAQIQLNTKKKKLGLWIDKNPVPPWEFRHK